MSNNSVNNRFMEFRLNEKLFAIPLLAVKEVILKPKIVQVPNAPAHFEGMMNLRGQILGIYSVRKKLSVQTRAATEQLSEVIIILEENGVTTGIVVDEVTRVLHPTPEQMKHAPLKDDNGAKDFVSHLIETTEGLVPLLLVNQLLELDQFLTESKAS
jgi:purine-binding chemotaxis protein CheW